MASMTEMTCKCGCGRKKMVRTADVNRGWGKFFSKSCKAKHQEKKTGQCGDYHHRQRTHTERDYDPEDDMHPFDPHALGQW